MEKSIIVAMATAVTLGFTSQFSTAGSITDTYTAGDTLTTTTLDNIKSAVNDNNNMASRFYGDGSAGSLTVSGFVTWRSTPPTGNNLNFTDLTIDAGSTLSVPAGTTIRCTGTFTNDGLIDVVSANNGGVYGIGSESMPGNTAPGRGDAKKRAAGLPSADRTLGVFLGGGHAGIGISKTVAASSFNNFQIGGGGGSGTIGHAGSPGGGLVKIYCQGAIINNGTISANGTGSAGRGGGGIVILASSTSIDNIGTMEANGGAGGNSDIFAGVSGGGGGGIIVMVAPTIASPGTTSVTGGAAGIGGTTLTNPTHAAGGGGGASGGDGGRGGGISAANVALDAISGFGNGTAGYVLEITANPAHMM